MKEKAEMTNPIPDLGPLESLLEDSTVMEILINSYDTIFVERYGILEETDVKFQSEAHLRGVMGAIVETMGRRLDESHPIVDVRLPDSTRMNVVIPPIALNGTSATIRKFPPEQLTWEQLIEFGALDEKLRRFLEACVVAGLNIVVSGGTGSGKTTILNRLTDWIPDDERLVTIETAGELQLKRKNIVRLEMRPPNIDGRGEVTMHDLVVNSLKMRPERIIVSEVRGGEVLDVFQAMNTGHDGSMFTLHANSPRDAMARLEVMATMASVDVPLLAIREQMASAIDVIIQQQRLRDGTRKILLVTEVVGMENQFITMQDIFEFNQTDVAEDRIVGRFDTTGITPGFVQRLNEAGYTFDDDFFAAPEA